MRSPILPQRPGRLGFARFACYSGLSDFIIFRCPLLLLLLLLFLVALLRLFLLLLLRLLLQLARPPAPRPHARLR
eukprot:8367101-Pyramimonas_sp.AAC.1